MYVREGILGCTSLSPIHLERRSPSSMTIPNTRMVVDIELTELCGVRFNVLGHSFFTGTMAASCMQVAYYNGYPMRRTNAAKLPIRQLLTLADLIVQLPQVDEDVVEFAESCVTVTRASGYTADATAKAVLPILSNHLRVALDRVNVRLVIGEGTKVAYSYADYLSDKDNPLTWLEKRREMEVFNEALQAHYPPHYV